MFKLKVNAIFAVKSLTNCSESTFLYVVTCVPWISPVPWFIKIFSSCPSEVSLTFCPLIGIIIFLIKGFSPYLCVFSSVIFCFLFGPCRVIKKTAKVNYNGFFGLCKSVLSCFSGLCNSPVWAYKYQI